MHNEGPEQKLVEEALSWRCYSIICVSLRPLAGAEAALLSHVSVVGCHAFVFVGLANGCPQTGPPPIHPYPNPFNVTSTFLPGPATVYISRALDHLSIFFLFQPHLKSRKEMPSKE